MNHSLDRPRTYFLKFSFNQTSIRHWNVCLPTLCNIGLKLIMESLSNMSCYFTRLLPFRDSLRLAKFCQLTDLPKVRFINCKPIFLLEELRKGILGQCPV